MVVTKNPFFKITSEYYLDGFESCFAHQYSGYTQITRRYSSALCYRDMRSCRPVSQARSNRAASHQSRHNWVRARGTVRKSRLCWTSTSSCRTSTSRGRTEPPRGCAQFFLAQDQPWTTNFEHFQGGLHLLKDVRQSDDIVIKGRLDRFDFPLHSHLYNIHQK